MSDWWGYEGNGVCPPIPYPLAVPTQASQFQGVDLSLALVTPGDTGVSTALPTAIGNRLFRTGDTMTGPLILSRDPVISLEAATKQYVDTSYVAAAAGARSPATELDLAVPLSVTLTSSGVGGWTPLVLNYTPASDRGATGFQGFSAEVLNGVLSQNPDGSGCRFLTEFNQTNLTVQTTDNATIGHSALTSHVTRALPRLASGALHTMVAGDILPTVWSLYGTAADTTGLVSSISGGLACSEYDIQLNAIDDLCVRGGHALNVDVKTAIANGGSPATIAQAFYSYGLTDAWVNIAYRAAGFHAVAGLDCRAVNGPSTTVATASTGTTVHVASFAPFTMGSNQLGTGTTPSNPVINVQIGANLYVVSGYASDGPGTRSGTLTLTTALQGTDGAVGTPVTRPFYGLMMRTGDQIAFDYAGNMSLGYSGAAFAGAGGLLSTMGLQAPNLEATNQVLASNGVSAGGTSGFAAAVFNGAVTMANGLTLTGGLFVPSKFTYATLPAAGIAPLGTIVYVSDGLKPGESAGAGTGVHALPNNARTLWLRMSDFTTLAH